MDGPFIVYDEPPLGSIVPRCRTGEMGAWRRSEHSNEAERRSVVHSRSLGRNAPFLAPTILAMTRNMNQPIRSFLDIRYEGDLALIRVEGSLDAEGATRVRAFVLGSAPSSWVLIDLSWAAEVTSIALAALIDLLERDPQHIRVRGLSERHSPTLRLLAAHHEPAGADRS